MLASHILDDSRGAALVCLWPPLVLVIFIDNGYLNVRTTSQPSGEVSLKVRVTQVAPLVKSFLVNWFVFEVHLRRPKHNILTIVLRKPCTDLGFSAPEFGNNAKQIVLGRKLCVWNCRGDMIRTPYNSVTATHEQLNVSMQQYTELPIKYDCWHLPSVWMAVLYELTLGVSMMLSDSGYAQSF